MAVPNTNNFSFTDIKTEIESNGGASTNSLVDAISNSIDEGFDSNYVGSKNSILNFRNYYHLAFDPFWSLTKNIGSNSALEGIPTLYVWLRLSGDINFSFDNVNYYGDGTSTATDNEGIYFTPYNLVDVTYTGVPIWVTMNSSGNSLVITNLNSNTGSDRSADILLTKNSITKTLTLIQIGDEDSIGGPISNPDPDPDPGSGDEISQ